MALRHNRDKLCAMKLGTLSDVHGNRVALDAVLSDGAAQGVDTWWTLGDLAAIGPQPVEVMERIANLPGCVVTRGNTDRYVVMGARPRPHSEDVQADPSLRHVFDAVERSFSWTHDVVAQSGWTQWLEQLPLETRTTLADGTRVLGVHASPGEDDGPGIFPDRPEEELRNALVGAACDIVIAGHTHRPTDRVVDEVRALNGGSLSNPVTADLRASYLVVEHDRHGHHVELRRVAYDTDRFLATLRDSGHPERDFIASFQRGEQVRA
jgi:predicted phosphodiesterase